MTKPLLIATIGLPRSGKSSFVGQLSKLLGAPIVRKDAIRLALHGMRYKLDAEPMIKTLALYMIRSLFEAGHPIVIADETHYSKAAREVIKSDKWDVAFLVVPTPIEVCKERALATEQPDLLPVIDEMAARYEPPEGEDILTYAYNTEAPVGEQLVGVWRNKKSLLT